MFLIFEKIRKIVANSLTLMRIVGKLLTYTVNRAGLICPLQRPYFTL